MLRTVALLTSIRKTGAKQGRDAWKRCVSRDDGNMLFRIYVDSVLPVITLMILKLTPKFFEKVVRSRVSGGGQQRGNSKAPATSSARRIAPSSPEVRSSSG